MKKTAALAIVVAGWMLAAAGSTLGMDGEAFVAAVADGKNDKALEIWQSHGPTIVNARDVNGNTALMAATKRRDDTWTGYLLTNGADVNIANREGETPLIAAARLGNTTAAQWMLSRGAKVNQANRLGETPLIVAVQQRQAAMVKVLLAKGANPDKADNAAGYSARDYARRDNRNRELLRLIEAQKAPAAPAN